MSNFILRQRGQKQPYRSIEFSRTGIAITANQIRYNYKLRMAKKAIGSSILMIHDLSIIPDYFLVGMLTLRELEIFSIPFLYTKGNKAAWARKHGISPTNVRNAERYVVDRINMRLKYVRFV
jgi:hypothetical protein